LRILFGQNLKSLTAQHLVASVRIYRIEGYVKGARFRLELTGTRASEVIERVYSIMGGRHGARRDSIKIVSVVELKPEEVRRREILQILSMDRIVVNRRLPT